VTILEDIRNRGNMTLVVRALDFREGRVPYAELEETVRGASVQWRGWDFPHIDPRANLRRGENWVGQDSAWNHHLEVWRLWTSGQFISISGFASEWRDRSEWWPADDNWSSGTQIGVFEVFLRFVEAYQFSSRLVLSNAGDEAMHIELKIDGLEGRTLVMDDPQRIPYLVNMKSELSSFKDVREIRRSDLVAEPTEFAIQAARELFLRFGLDMSEGDLRAALSAFNERLSR
jgi:hypothetical protein